MATMAHSKAPLAGGAISGDGANLSPCDAIVPQVEQSCQPFLDAALAYAGAGLCPVICDRAAKYPKGYDWKQYQNKRPDQNTLRAWFDNGHADGLCLICGETSGNLEAIDFDAPELWADWCACVEDLEPGLLSKLVILRTQSGGYHIPYRCPVIGENDKLAQAWKSDGSKPTKETLFETRGEGGLIVTYPTEGYTILQGDLLNLPTITPDERAILSTAARSFNLATDENKPGQEQSSEGGRPGDDYDERGEVLPLLESHGWQVVSKAGEAVRLRRPGKDRGGCSATWNYIPRRFYVFSTNAYPFDSERTYTPFAVYSMLEQGGITKEAFSAAASELRAKGFGSNGTTPAASEWTTPTEPPAIVEAFDQTAERERSTEAQGAMAWRFRTLTDAYAPRQPLKFAIDGLLTMPSLSIVYGAPGCLKSFLAADAALCVACGLPWLPPIPTVNDTTPRDTALVPVVWLDFDNGTRRTDERIEALARVRNLEPESTPFYYVSMPSPWLDGSDPAGIDALADRLAELNAGLVVIDNLGVVSGGADENSADMIQVLANFRRLAESTGAAVVLIHHQRKSSGYNGRAGETLRGHSSIEAALDLALLVEREERAPEVTVKSTKSRDVDVLPFGAIFTYEHRPGSKELATARFWGTPVKDTSPGATARRAIIEALEDAGEPMTKGALVKAAKAIEDIGTNTLRGVIDRMAEDGTLTMTPGARNAQYYELALV